MSGRFARGARIATAAGVAVLLALGTVVWSLARSGAIDAWLGGRIATVLGSRVRFAAVHALWWPRPGVELEQVGIAAAGAPSGDAPGAAAIRCRLRLGPLLVGRVVVGSVQVDGLHLVLERGSDGTFHAEGTEQLLAQAPGGDAASSVAWPTVRLRNATIALRADAAGAVPVLQLQALNARLVPSGAGARIDLAAHTDRGGSVRVRGDVAAPIRLGAPRFSGTVDVDRLDAAAVSAWLGPSSAGVSIRGLLRLTAHVEARGTGSLEGNGVAELSAGAVQWSGWEATTPLRLAARAAWNGSALAVTQGRLDGARIVGAPLSFDTLTASFEYGGGALSVDAAQLRAWGGTWRPSGRITFGDPVGVDARLQAEGINAARLAAALARAAASLPTFDAPLRLAAAASGVVGGAWSGHADIETDGGLAWSGGRADGPLAAGADLRGQGAIVALENGRARASRIAAGPLVATALDGSFAYADGTIRVTALQGTAFGSAWTYRGTLPADARASWSGALTGMQLRAAAVRDALAPGASDPVDGAVDVSARLTGDGAGTITGTATGRVVSALAWRSVRVDPPAEVSASWRAEGAAVTLSNGRASASIIGVGDLAVRDVSAAFSYGNDTLRLAALRAAALGGRWNAAGTVAVAGRTTWHATVDGAQFDPDPLLRELTGGDAAGPRTEGVLADVSLSLTGGHDKVQGTATVQLGAGAFRWAGLRVEGPAHARGAFAVNRGTFQLTHATADAAHAAFGSLVGTAPTARLRYRGHRLSFDDLRFTSCGGAWTHNGWFSLAGDEEFAGQLRVEGADPLALAAMLADESLALPFARANLDTEFRGHTTPEWMSTLQATGAVMFTDGAIPATTVLGPIWDGLVGPGRISNRLERATNRVTQLSDTFTLRQGSFETTDLSLSSEDYDMTGVGSLGFDGSLNLSSRIRLTAHGVQKMLVFAALPLPTSALPSLPPIPAHITGMVSHPVVRPNVSALPASTARWFVDAVLHAPRTVGGAIVGRVRGLWNRVTGGADSTDEPPAAP